MSGSPSVANRRSASAAGTPPFAYQFSTPITSTLACESFSRFRRYSISASNGVPLARPRFSTAPSGNSRTSRPRAAGWCPAPCRSSRRNRNSWIPNNAMPISNWKLPMVSRLANAESTHWAALSAMNTLRAGPLRMSTQPEAKSSGVTQRGCLSCGRRLVGRSIGPATSVGK